MIDCDVAIVGAGPVGLLLANLLGRRAVSTYIVDKRSTLYDLPRAIHFDGEAMRVFQSAGLADQIEPDTFVGKGMLFQDMSGTTLIDWSRDQTPGPMGWFESYRFHQPSLEDVLAKGLARFGIPLQRGVAATAVRQAEDHVLLDLSTGQTLRARYVVGCDGAQSFVRQALDMGWKDLGFQERWLVVDVALQRERPDLGDYSIQYCHPETPATYVRGIENRRRWEIRLGADDPQDPSDAMVWQKLAPWITPQDAVLERAAIYTFRSGVAEAWQSDRVFLVGDAAHQMPPFMGQGMCAGVRDCANLAWKLALALHGKPALLATYQSEREANVRQFIDLSMALGRLINQTDPEHLPKGRMKSIWPDLGHGLGPRDGVSGALVPQGLTQTGRDGDDRAFPGFYILSDTEFPDSHIPVFRDATGWLQDRNLLAVLVRPDGYALAGIPTKADLMAALGHIP